MLYMAYELQSELISPLRWLARELGASLRTHRVERTMLRKIGRAHV